MDVLIPENYLKHENNIIQRIEWTIGASFIAQSYTKN
jgi:hypothetical protein